MKQIRPLWPAFTCWIDDEEDRWLLWLPVALSAGISIYFYIPFEPALNEALGCAGLLLLSVFFFFFYTHRFARFCCLLSIAILGFISGCLRTYSLQTIMINAPHKNWHFSGYVTDIEQKPHGKRVTISSIQAPSAPFLDKVRLTTSTLPNIGEYIEGTADLYPLSAPFNGFDFKRDAYFKGIGSSGRLSVWRTIRVAEDRFFIRAFRQKLTTLFLNKIGDEEGAIAAALITGDRAAISNTVRQNFTDAGLAHVLAISGLHFGLVAALVFALIRRTFSAFPLIAERFLIKKWAAVTVIPVMIFYLLISGAGLPAQRAFVMLLLAMIGIMIDRPVLSMRLVAIAATVILLYAPESLLSVSFQLSFAAVIALVAAYESGWTPLKNWVVRGGFYRKIIAYAIGIIATTLIATIATTPLTIFVFNRFTAQAVLGNLLAIPLTALFIMPSLMLCLVTAFWEWPFQIARLGIHLLTKISEYVSSLPGAAIMLPTPPLSFLLLTTIGGLWITLWKTKKRWLGVPIFASGLLAIFWSNPPDILVSANGEVMAYRLEDTLYISTSPTSFYADFWGREVGASRVETWPNPVMVFQKNGQKVLLAARGARSYKYLKENYSRHSHVLCGFSTYGLSCEKKTITFKEKKDFSTPCCFWLTHKGLRDETPRAHKRPWKSP